MQIVAIGGGGLAAGQHVALERYALDLAKKRHPRVCLLHQASAEDDRSAVGFVSAFIELGAVPAVLSLFRLPTADLASYLGEMDLIYVGGGNLRSMLTVWREWHLDRILKEIAEAGTILAGTRAGAVCWFEQAVTDSVPGRLSVVEALGYLKGSLCAHYRAEPRRRPTFLKWVGSGRIAPGIGLDEGAALHFIGQELRAVLQSQDGAGAVRVEVENGRSVERTLIASRLEKVVRRWR